MFEQNLSQLYGRQNAMDQNFGVGLVRLGDLAGITPRGQANAKRAAMYERAFGKASSLAELAGPDQNFVRPAQNPGNFVPPTNPGKLEGNGQPESRAPNAAQTAYQQSQPAMQPMADQGQGLSRLELAQIMQDPYADEGEKAFARTLLMEQMKPVDPYEERLKKLKLAQAEQDLKTGARRSLQPVWGVGPDGKPAIVQLGDDGSAIRTQLPEGFQISNKPIEMDLGTKILLLDPQTRAPVGERPKDIAGVEAAKEIGTVQGKQIAGASGDVATADNALAVLDNLLNDPVMTQPNAWGTGLSSMANAIPGTPGYNFQTKIDQVQGVAFLQAIQQLRGMGALSNTEGETARSAITRIRSGLSQDDLRTAIGELRTIIETGRARALARTGELGAAPAPSAPSSGGYRILSVE